MLMRKSFPKTKNKCSTAVEGACADSSSLPITFTLVTAPRGRILTKHYELGQDGQLAKKLIATFGRGSFDTVSALSMRDFVDCLNKTTPAHAHLYSVCSAMSSGKLIAEAFRDHDDPNQASRTKMFFEFPAGPAIVAVDVDAPKKGEPLQKDSLIAILVQEFPFLLKTAVVYAVSASACIYRRDTGEQLRGVTGQRLYFSVQDGRDIPRLFSILIARLYIAGYGRYEVSASGALLERSIADRALSVPTQPDFCGGASVGPGLEQRRPLAQLLWDGHTLDSRQAFQDLSDDEIKTYDDMRAKDRKALGAEAAEVREQWLMARLDEIVRHLLERDGKPASDPAAVRVAKKEARSILEKSLDTKVLHGDFVLRLTDGSAVTVRDVLRYSDRYHGTECLDPIEPEYDGGRGVGKLYLQGKKPRLHSLAHGGSTYALMMQRARILVAPGELSQCVDDTLDELRQDPRSFSRGQTIVRIQENGKVLEHTPATLTKQLGSDFRYYKLVYDKDQGEIEVPVNPPAMLSKMIVELGAASGLRPLTGLVTAPLMLPGGRLLMTPGYDNETGLYLHITRDDWPDLPVDPTPDELRDAFDVLWRPYSAYPWQDDLARGVALALMLTAIVRPGLKITPGFAVQAATQSSGKTLVTQAAGAIALGAIPPVTAIEDSDHGGGQEIAKGMLAAAIAGKTVILLDNVVGYLEQPTIAAYLTSEMIEGRILGLSKLSGALSFRMLLCVSGNNLQLGPDMSQRLLVATIDPQSADPELREFAFDPAQMALAHRQEIVTAGLTLLRGYLAAGSPIVVPGVSRFADWDRLVRQPVVWIARTLGLNFGDPIESVARYKTQDSERETHGAFLAAWWSIWEGNVMTSQELYSELEDIEGYKAFLRIKGDLRTFFGPRRELLDLVLSWSRNGRVPGVRTLGNILRNRRGKRIDGYMLERVGEQHGGVSLWRVVKLPDEPVAAT